MFSTENVFEVAVTSVTSVSHLEEVPVLLNNVLSPHSSKPSLPLFLLVLQLLPRVIAFPPFTCAESTLPTSAQHQSPFLLHPLNTHKSENPFTQALSLAHLCGRGAPPQIWVFSPGRGEIPSRWGCHGIKSLCAPLTSLVLRRCVTHDYNYHYYLCSFPQFFLHALWSWPWNSVLLNCFLHPRRRYSCQLPFRLGSSPLLMAPCLLSTWMTRNNLPKVQQVWSGNKQWNEIWENFLAMPLSKCGNCRLLSLLFVALSAQGNTAYLFALAVIL